MTRRNRDAKRPGRGSSAFGGRALLTGLLLAGGVAGPSAAQDGARAQPTPAPASPGKATTVSGVVVTGRRPVQPGAVVGDIKPELQLGPEDIESYGVSTLTELIDELAPETRSDRGRGGEAPVILLNGRRISSFFEIRDIPTEAILRVDILPEEVSLKYGYTANQRVVNIVLKPEFRAVTGEGRAGGATEGGRVSGQAEADLFTVHGDNRLNFDLKYQASSHLTEADRDIIPVAPAEPFALGGNVSSPRAGAEIDPALSALAGRPVTVASIPAGADGRPLTLSDFAGAAPNDEDIRRYRTLLPATQQLSANAVLSRAFGGLSATANAAFSANTSDALQGLPTESLTVPAGNSYSPFGAPVLVSRYTDAFGPLRQNIDGWTGHLGSTLNHDAGDWRLSLTDAYDHADTRTRTDTGVIVQPLQAMLDSGTASFDPFAPLPASLLALRAQDVARVTSDSANIQFLGNGPLFKVPAGPLYASVKVGDSQSWLGSASDRQGIEQSINLARNDFNAQINLDLPITSLRYHVLSAIGDLSITGNAAVDKLSDFGTLPTLGYGLNWTPIEGVNLIVSKTRDHAVPTIQQLGNPVVVTPGVPILDYATGQTVYVTQVSGGTRSLAADTRDVVKIGLTLKPIPDQDLTFQANYIDSRIRNPIATFPAATLDIEAAFPDRFLRDAGGELTEVDYRPVNFASQDRKELRWGFNYSRPIGPQPTRRFGRPGWNGRGQDNRPRPPQADTAPPDSDRAAAQGRSAQQPQAENDDEGPRGPGPGGRGFGSRGFGRGGRGGGGPGGRLQFAVYHTVFFEDRILVRPGGPLLDLLNGAAASSTGGQPRHEIEAQAGYLLNGLGARLSADWKSGTAVRGGSGLPSDDLTFSGLTTLNVRFFANFSGMRTFADRHPWLKGARLTLSVANLFDQRLRVRDAAGLTPLGYQAAYLDPAGRTVQLSFRKLFF